MQENMKKEQKTPIHEEEISRDDLDNIGGVRPFPEEERTDPLREAFNRKRHRRLNSLGMEEL